MKNFTNHTVTQASSKIKFTFLMFGFLSGLMALTCLSVLAVPPNLEEIIQDKISERHPTDTPTWWQSLGPEAPKTIIGIYEKTGGIYQRTRLLGALSWYHDADAIAFLKKQAEGSSQDVIRNSAIQAVGNAGGAAEVEFLGKFLDHEDPQTRVAAGKALKKIGDPKANALLQKFYVKESMPWVKDRIQETSPVKLGSDGPLLRIASKTPVSLNAAWTGSWKGVLIVPSIRDAGRDAGLVRLDAQSKTEIENVTGLKGEVTLQIPASSLAPSTASGAAPRTVSLKLYQVSGRDTRVSGWLKGDALKEWGAKGGSIHFEGELLERGAVRILKIESREILLTLVLRSG